MATKNECWKKRSRLEQVLVVFIIILSILVLCLFIHLLATTHDKQICNRPECVRAAIHILDFIDPSVDPCDNFYNFVCGSYVKNSHTSNQHALQYLADITKDQLKKIVTTNANDESTPHSLKLQRQFYRACLNTTIIDQDDDKTFLKLLDKIGGWPILKGYSWKEDNYSWPKVMLTAKEIGLPFYFFMKVVVRDNPEPTIIQISPPQRKLKYQSDWQERNIEVMTDIAHLLGAPSAGTSTELRRTMQFAQQLDIIIEKAWNNTLFKEVPIKNITDKYVKIFGLDFLKTLTNQSELTEDDKVYFDGDYYLKELYYILLQTPKRIQANYICWYMLTRNMQFLSTKIRNKYKEMTQLNNIESRDDLCYKISIERFNYVAESEYVRRYGTQSKKDHVKEMLSNLKNEFQKILKHVTWMEMESKTEAFDILGNITEMIGWADNVYDIDDFENVLGFTKLNFSSNNIVDMVTTLAKHKSAYIFNSIGQNSSEIDLFYYYPKLDVNAYYELRDNQIILPAPILQGLVFDTERPQYMNYGSLGSILGHELTHSLVYYGNMHVGEEIFNFYTNKTEEDFEIAIQCLKDEYDTFVKDYKDIKNSTTTLQENLADFTGVPIAYRAYQQWVRKHGTEEFLPGVNFSPNQIFWIMSTSYLCGQPKITEGKFSKADQFHAPKEFRMFAALRNTDYFGRDYNCPVGSPMNPKKKCQVFL